MPTTARAVLFDLLGTLLDTRSVAQHIEGLFPGHGGRLADLWRKRQLQYTWLRALSNRYVPFTQLTEDSLRTSCEEMGLKLDAAACGFLMHEYTQLSAFADTLPALNRLKAAGVTVGVLTNADPGLAEDVLHAGGLVDVFDLVLSADAVRSYKTSPAVYALGPQALGHPAGEIAFVSSNAWDAAGAQAFGYRAFWVNRSGAPLERLGVEPEGTGSSLDDAVRFALAATAHQEPR